MGADASARCAADDAPAMGVCERCGKFICPRCGFQQDDHLRCHDCGPPDVERPPPLPQAALLLAAVGLMCPPLSLLGLGMALVYRFGRDFERGRLGEQYARWALWLGAASLVAGGLIYAFALTIVAV
jgi:hypothetical protein